MGNRNGKSRGAAKGENASEEAKQEEPEGSVNAQDQLAPKEKGTDVDEINKADDIVTDLKANTDLDDEQCDRTGPAEKNDYKYEDKKEMESKEFANEINTEKEQNADFTGNGIVSTSEGVKIEETEAPIVPTHLAENIQSPLKMEALNEQAIVTETEINAADKVDTESNLSKPSGDTVTGVTEINTVKETNCIKFHSIENIVKEPIEDVPKEGEESMPKSDSFENIEEDSTANVPKEDEKMTPITSEQERSSEEIALTDNGDNVQEMDVKISEVISLDEPTVYDTKHAQLCCDEFENARESWQENEDKPAAITSEITIEIACMKDDHSNKNNEGDSTSKTDSTDKHEATVKEEEHTTSTEANQEEVKNEVEQGNLQDEQKEVSCVQPIIEPISSEIVKKINENCLETGIEGGKENASESLEKVTWEFCWKDGGNDVQILGSFDNFEKKIDMSKSKNEFVISIDLVPGEYTYRFCVDGEWKVDENKQIIEDSAGNKNNVVNVAKQVQ